MLLYIPTIYMLLFERKIIPTSIPTIIMIHVISFVYDKP